MILFQVLIVSLTTLSCLGEPYKNMSIGMEISLPSDGKVVATSSEPPSCMIQGGFGQSSWHMKFDRVLDTQKKSARELVQLALERHKSSGGIKIIDDMAMQCGKIEGWWTRISLPIKDGRDSTICWLVLPIRGNQALMASILTTQEAWQLSGKSLLSSIQSIKPLDPLTTLSERITGLDNATTLLSDLSAQSLSEVIGISSWRQIQKSQDGQIRPIEIGYAHIESRIGTKNEVGAGKESNQEKGLVVEIHSRIIPDQESQIVTDTSGYYWMSFDGKEEIWSSTSTRWKGKIQTTQKETGIRQRPSLGNPNPKLLILRQDLTSNRQLPPIEATISSPWLPKTLSWVIGPLIETTRPTTLSWRTLNDFVDPPIETMRTDDIKITEIGFSVTTRFGDSDSVVVTDYGNDGQLLRQTLDGGIVILGTNEKALSRIWEPKDLW